MSSSYSILARIQIYYNYSYDSNKKKNTCNQINKNKKQLKFIRFIIYLYL